jgi:hypothetical protein
MCRYVEAAKNVATRGICYKTVQHYSNQAPSIIVSLAAALCQASGYTTLSVHDSFDEYDARSLAILLLFQIRTVTPR